MATTQQTYRTTKALSDHIFGKPERVVAALKLAVRKSRREKLILKQLNELTNEK